MSKGGAVRWTPQMLEAYEKRLKPVPDGAPEPAKVGAPIPAQTGTPKAAKYRNRKVTDSAGVTHDSAKEARRWAILEQWQQAGLISDLRRQVSFELAPAVKLEGEARTKPALRYWADFVYLQDGRKVVEDVKSPPTRKKEAYRIKRHLMAAVHGVHIKEI